MNLMPANVWEAQQMFDSGVPTELLIAMACTAPVCRDSGRNELYGREYAYYAIAHTQLRAIEFILRETIGFNARRIACEALAAAGYGAGYVIEQSQVPG